MPAHIYGLYDGLGQLRYIGKSSNPVARLKSHMRDARRRNTPLYAWLRKHGLPDLRVIEFNCADWQDAERRHIAASRAAGIPLLNVADGGDEPFCSHEVRSANGKKSGAYHKNREWRAIWSLKRSIGAFIQRGELTEANKEKLRYSARKAPHLFGEYATL